MTGKFIKKEEKVTYQLQADGTFVIENYNQARPFASFFPGIAGLKGVPMWVFYVNRGQGIASFGLKNKNYSMMEFQPADKSYGLVPNIGFRTFIKIKKAGQSFFYEPWQNNSANNEYKTKQKMLIRPAELGFEEIVESLGLKLTVTYFTLPQEPIAALVRIVELENISAAEINLELIDGLPKIIPYWMSNDILKYMSHTAKAWAKVTNFEQTGVPFYRLKMEIIDKPEVQELKEGNFYFSLKAEGSQLKKLPIIIDPELIFDEVTDYNYPATFLQNHDFILPEKQYGDSKYPSAMAFFSGRLAPGEKQKYYSLFGHIGSEQQLESYVARLNSPDYFSQKKLVSSQLVEEVTRAIATTSGSKEFDLYCRQTYLDNVLRGGLPINLSQTRQNIIYYVYSRKHGDLERDYNNYQIAPTYYSQGDGNFRDVNQNKRCNIFFNTQIGDFDVVSFYNLMQLDGYNPLLVKGTYFSLQLAGRSLEKLLNALIDKRQIPLLKNFFARQFEPGSLLLFLEEKQIELKVKEEEFLSQILNNSQRINEAEHGEGFWTDHWIYNLDLLENYLAIYPEKIRDILLDEREFTFYDNAHIVMPRAEKYVEVDGKIRQFGSVIRDLIKTEMLKNRTYFVHLVRVKNGRGEIYKTVLLTKLICLLINKLATLDPEGIGMEMEADKPSWYDALNGLPGVFGSSVSETFELKRLIQFLRENLAQLRLADNYKISLPVEMHRFFSGLKKLLSDQRKLSAFTFWDAASSLKEKYRQETISGISGKEKVISYGEVTQFLDLSLAKVNKGLNKAMDENCGLYYTYYTYEAIKYESIKNKKGIKVSHKGWPCVRVKKFARRPLPLFLEAEVHYFKTEKNIEKIKALHEAVQNSPLYDQELKMYKVNASLSGEPADIGRCTVFAPGWLENESIWLHMEYKYLLELLKRGLYAEFFNAFEKAVICFLEPQDYGRSILENSSFIVSSAFPDKRMWGRGCVARLSGSTAEFLEIWILMTIGANPFRLAAKGELILEFKPALPARYFAADKTFSCAFLGQTQLVYHNNQAIDTFSDKFRIEKIQITWSDGGLDEIQGSVIERDFAKRVRSGEAKKIEIFF